MRYICEITDGVWTTSLYIMDIIRLEEYLFWQDFVFIMCNNNLKKLINFRQLFDNVEKFEKTVYWKVIVLLVLKSV